MEALQTYWPRRIASNLDFGLNVLGAALGAAPSGGSLPGPGGSPGGGPKRSREEFDKIVSDYAEFAQSIGINAFTPIPISGVKGDNITTNSASINWAKTIGLVT